MGFGDAIQTASAVADNDTFGSAPKSGSLLLALGGERSGATSSSISGGGTWTEQVELAHKSGNTTHRLFGSVYWKIADGTETGTITITNADYIVLVEIELEGETISFEQEAENSTDADDEGADIASFSSGTTPSVSTTDNLLVGVTFVKVRNVTGQELSPDTATNSLTLIAEVNNGGGDVALSVFTHRDSTSGTKESTFSDSDMDDTNRSVIGAMLVWSVDTGIIEESGTQNLVFVTTGAEVQDHILDGSQTLVFQATGAEAQDFIEAGPATLVYQPSVSEIVEAVESGETTLVLNTTGELAQDLVESGAETVVFSTSGSEVQDQIDAGETTLVLLATGELEGEDPPQEKEFYRVMPDPRPIVRREPQDAVRSGKS